MHTQMKTETNILFCRQFSDKPRSASCMLIQSKWLVHNLCMTRRHRGNSSFLSSRNLQYWRESTFSRLMPSMICRCWLGGGKGIRPVKKWRDGGGGHWLVRMEWRPAGWSVCLPQLIFPCTIKSRSSLLELAHPGGPGKRAVERLWCGSENLLLDVNCSLSATSN